ncbi:MAG: TIGR02266 family protein [Deltaproteobacteria bacterium]|nr:TIGR02266 family protein [Deltaproteobacteria bacterium]
MTPDSTHQQLLVQIIRAREALGNALGLIQDINVSHFDLGKVTSLLATSVRSLFEAQEQQLTKPAPLKSAMKNLRDILQMMQNVDSGDARLQAATTTIARILAILFPVYKELTKPAVAPTGTGAARAPQKSSAAQPMQPPPDDRRSTPRKLMEVDLGGQSDSNFFTGFTTDISSGGLFVATYDAPQIGHLVNLNFRLPSGPVMSIDGEVCWCREYNEMTPDTPPGVGVRFLHLSADDAQNINAYMKHVQPMFFDE